MDSARVTQATQSPNMPEFPIEKAEATIQSEYDAPHAVMDHPLSTCDPESATVMLPRPTEKTMEHANMQLVLSNPASRPVVDHTPQDIIRVIVSGPSIHEYRLRTVLQNRCLSRISQSPWYGYLVVLYMLTVFAVAKLAFVVWNTPVLGVGLVLPGLFFFVCELNRMKRDLLYQLAWSFEWYYLVLNTFGHTGVFLIGAFID